MTKSGGGYTSNQVVRPGVRSGPPNTNLISPRGVSQYGYAPGSTLKKDGSYTTQNSALPVNQGTARQVPSGNAVAASTVAGPGGSRTVYRSGTQATHGPAAGPAPVQGRDIFREFPASQSQGNTGASSQKR